MGEAPPKEVVEPTAPAVVKDEKKGKGGPLGLGLLASGKSDATVEGDLPP